MRIKYQTLILINRPETLITKTFSKIQPIRQPIILQSPNKNIMQCITHKLLAKTLHQENKTCTTRAPSL